MEKTTLGRGVSEIDTKKALAGLYVMAFVLADVVAFLVVAFPEAGFWGTWVRVAACLWLAFALSLAVLQPAVALIKRVVGLRGDG
jgi:hypothetical protein